MLPSWRLAANSLTARRGRTALISAAVSLACSLVVAVACGVASIQASMERQLASTLGASDARVVHQFNGRFDEHLLDTVRSWPQVQYATGRLTGTLTLIRADHGTDPETGRPRRTTCTGLGVDPALERRFREVTLSAGRDLAGPGQIIIDPLTVQRLDAKVGDVLAVQRFGEPIELTVVGIYDRQMIGALQRLELQIDRRTLAEAAGHQGELTSIAIILNRGVDVNEFCKAHGADLPKALSLEPAEMARTGFDRRVEAGRLGLVFASVLAFLCASFIIVTGLTTAVTERQREMALARCIGASRGQLFASQLWVGAVVGAAGAAVGVPLGIALAWCLVWWFDDLLPAGLSISWLGLSLAVAGSLGAGLGGALYPAWKAARTTPLQAMAVGARPLRVRSMALCTAAGALCLLVQLALGSFADEQVRFWAWVIAGAPILHVGYFLLAVPLLLLTARVAAPAISLVMRLPRELLGRSVLATPFRHGFTAGALMVGMSVLVSTWSAGGSLLSDWLGRIRFADGFAFRTTGITQQQQEAITSLPFVQEVCPIGYLPLRVIGEQVFGVQGLAPPNVICVPFPPETFFRLNAIDWIDGSPATAIPRLEQGDAVIVAREFKTVRGLTVGDHITLGAGRVTKEFEIVGVVESAGLELAIQYWGIRSVYSDAAIHCVFMDWDTAVKTFDNHDAYMLQINLSQPLSDEKIRDRITQVAPGVGFRSGRFIKRAITKIATALLSVNSTIAFAALLLACLGVANVIVANIHSRRFEYGVLRAVGAQRGLLLRLILGEVMIMTLTGCLTGALMGLHVAAVSIDHYRRLIGLDLRSPVPVKAIAIGLAIMMAMTLLAALPAAIRLMRTSTRALLAAGRGG